METKKIIAVKKNYFVIFLSLLIFATSCSQRIGIAKRKYTSGYYTIFHVFDKKINFDNGEKFENIKFVTALKNKEIINEIEENALVCNTHSAIKNNRNRQLRNIRKNFAVKHSDFVKQKYVEDTLVNINKGKEIQKSANKKTEPLGVVSFILGLSSDIFLMVIWNVTIATVFINIVIVTLILEMILGLISMVRIKGSSKYKGIGWAIIGVLLGDIGICAAFLWLIGQAFAGLNIGGF